MRIGRPGAVSPLTPASVWRATMVGTRPNRLIYLARQRGMAGAQRLGTGRRPSVRMGEGWDGEEEARPDSDSLLGRARRIGIGPGDCGRIGGADAGTKTPDGIDAGRNKAAGRRKGP